MQLISGLGLNVFNQDSQIVISGGGTISKSGKTSLNIQVEIQGPAAQGGTGGGGAGLAPGGGGAGPAGGAGAGGAGTAVPGAEAGGLGGAGAGGTSAETGGQGAGKTCLNYTRISSTEKNHDIFPL